MIIVSPHNRYRYSINYQCAVLGPSRMEVTPRRMAAILLLSPASRDRVFRRAYTTARLFYTFCTIDIVFTAATWHHTRHTYGRGAIGPAYVYRVF